MAMEVEKDTRCVVCDSTDIVGDVAELPGAVICRECQAFRDEVDREGLTALLCGQCGDVAEVADDRRLCPDCITDSDQEARSDWMGWFIGVLLEDLAAALAEGCNDWLATKLAVNLEVINHYQYEHGDLMDEFRGRGPGYVAARLAGEPELVTKLQNRLNELMA